MNRPNELFARVFFTHSYEVEQCAIRDVHAHHYESSFRDEVAQQTFGWLYGHTRLLRVLIKCADPALNEAVIRHKGSLFSIKLTSTSM